MTWVDGQEFRRTCLTETVDNLVTFAIKLEMFEDGKTAVAVGGCVFCEPATSASERYVGRGERRNNNYKNTNIPPV